MKIDVEARREKILRIIINTFIATGSPISSRAICNKYKVGLCPASVRNVMADLEEKGYITHLHTSAGRIPTDQGYRFYVDKLLKNTALTSQERTTLTKEFVHHHKLVEDVIGKTSRILSDFTHYAGLVSGPQIRRTKFKHVQFLHLEPKKACVTLVTNTGMIKSAIIRVDSRIDQDKLTRIQNFLNEQLADTPLHQIKSKLRRMMIQERNSFFHVLKQAMELIEESAIVDEKMRFHLDGLSNVLNFPEFENLEIIRELMHGLDEKKVLKSLIEEIIDEDNEKQVRVFIGKENPGNFSNDCTIILASYKINNQKIGGLGIIGPKRMDYAKAIATVQYVSDGLSEMLTKLSI